MGSILVLLFDFLTNIFDNCGSSAATLILGRNSWNAKVALEPQMVAHVACIRSPLPRKDKARYGLLQILMVGAKTRNTVVGCLYSMVGVGILQYGYVHTIQHNALTPDSIKHQTARRRLG